MCRVYVLITIILACSLSSCNSLPSQSPQSEGGDVQSFEDDSSPPLRAVLQAYRWKRTLPEKSIGDDVADAILWNGSGTSVNGGKVMFNGLQIPVDESSAGASYHLAGYPGTTVPLRFDGSYQVFRVVGNPAFNPLADSLQSPTSAVSISTPSAGAALSKSSGFTVTWNSGNAQGAVIYLMDTSRAPGHKAVVRQVDDDGSHIFSAGDLASLVPGRLRIDVTQGNYKESVTPDGRRYKLAIYSSDMIETTLVP